MMLLLFHVLYTLISPYVGYHAREREYGSLPGMIGVAAEMRCVGGLDSVRVMKVVG